MSVTPVQRRRRHIKRILAKRNGYQFGQPAATTTKVKGGAVACMDTSIQLVYRIWTGKRLSLDRIRTISGAPVGRPTPGKVVAPTLQKLGLPYVYKTGLTPAQLMRIARNKGPVIIAEMYWAHPEWQGYRYLGRIADGRSLNNAGRPVLVGFARPSGQAGKTQLSGFVAGHAIVLATSEDRGSTKVTDWNAIVRDSNHNSKARPERPMFDRLTLGQWRRMVNSIRPKNGGRVCAWVPTRALKVGEA